MQKTKLISSVLIILGIIGFIAAFVRREPVLSNLVGLSDTSLLLGLAIDARNSLRSATLLLGLSICTTVAVLVENKVGFYPAIPLQRWWAIGALNGSYLTITVGLIFVAVHMKERLGIGKR